MTFQRKALLDQAAPAIPFGSERKTRGLAEVGGRLKDRLYIPLRRAAANLHSATFFGGDMKSTDRL